MFFCCCQTFLGFDVCCSSVSLMIFGVLFTAGSGVNTQFDVVLGVNLLIFSVSFVVLSCCLLLFEVIIF